MKKVLEPHHEGGAIKSESQKKVISERDSEVYSLNGKGITIRAAAYLSERV